MSLETRLAAFVEYVVRPMSEDWRRILEQMVALQVPLTPDLIKWMAWTLGIWHLLGELIRAFCYLGVTWLICQVIVKVWPS